ncbi:MAG: 6-bladed beta-propeller [Bacteroidales bacterium]|nr:6-bladed beta-propeller [Bacteroidales bacterium]
MKDIFFLTYVITFFFITGCVSSSFYTRFTEEEINSVYLNNSQSLEITDKYAKKIDLNKGVGSQRIEQSKLIDTLFFLPLETNEESVFGMIRKILITEDRIIVKDDLGRFLIFNNEGKFISKSVKGNGPGEIYKLWDIAYDETTQRIIAYQSDYLSFFDKNGKFIESKKCPIIFRELCVIDNRFVFFQEEFENYHLGNVANNAIIVTDRNLAMVAKGASTCPFKLVNTATHIQKKANEIVVSQIFNDTIFAVNSSNISAKYIIDYDSQKNRGKRIEDIENSDDFYYTGSLLETDKTQLFMFWSPKYGVCCTFRDNATNNVVGGSIIANNERELPLCIFNTKTVYKDFFVSYNIPYTNMHYNSSAISEIDNNKIAQLTEDDNAVLIFYKVKELR